MNDTAIRNYCAWARNELIAGVEARMRPYGMADRMRDRAVRNPLFLHPRDVNAFPRVETNSSGQIKTNRL